MDQGFERKLNESSKDWNKKLTKVCIRELKKKLNERFTRLKRNFLTRHIEWPSPVDIMPTTKGDKPH